MTKQVEIDEMKIYISTLKDWVRTHGEQNDICTYHILKNEICSGCNCKKKLGDKNVNWGKK